MDFYSEYTFARLTGSCLFCRKQITLWDKIKRLFWGFRGIFLLREVSCSSSCYENVVVAGVNEVFRCKLTNWDREEYLLEE